MKMISLLLLILSSCLCAATFVVNVTQSSYEAEENHSITLEWTFTTRTQGSYRELSIYCDLRNSVLPIILYAHHDGVEFPDSQDDRFSGRVQCDKDVLREGRIRLHMSRLRTEDSGEYGCDVMTEDGFNSGGCLLKVTAPADQLLPQRPTLTPKPETWIIMTILIMVIMFSIICLSLIVKIRKYYVNSVSDKHMKEECTFMQNS